MTDWNGTEPAWRVKCPHCWASPHNRCESSSGRILSYPHMARVRAAEKTKNEPDTPPAKAVD